MVAPSTITPTLAEDATTRTSGKIEVVPGENDSLKTFIIEKEDHTLGNALRHVVMKQEATAFAGYTIPHPSEYRIHMRVQTKGDNASHVLRQAAVELHGAISAVEESFDAALEDFWSDKTDRHSMSTAGLGPLALPGDASKATGSGTATSKAMEED